MGNVPVVNGYSAIAAPAGPLHIGSVGNSGATASIIEQHVTTGAGTYPAAVAPNLSFYRINQNTVNSSYILPLADNALGSIIAGSVNTTVDPNTSASRKNAAQFSIKAEKAWTASGTNLNYTPTYFVWSSTPNGGNYVERMRLDSSGNLGVGTTGTPTSKLQVVGLPQYINNAAAINGGLTPGAFYRTGADPDVVCVVH